MDSQLLADVCNLRQKVDDLAQLFGRALSISETISGAVERMRETSESSVLPGKIGLEAVRQGLLASSEAYGFAYKVGAELEQARHDLDLAELKYHQARFNEGMQELGRLEASR